VFVVDASVTLEWFLPAQSSILADRAWETVRKSLLIVPPLWLWETHSVLLRLHRQRRISNEDVLEARVNLSLLNKRVVEPPDQHAIDATWEIAGRQMLTFYDAAYLELCVRLELPLASTDTGLRNAAKNVGIRLV
jgi:predicted nucleic acid-binding protein